MEFSLYAVVTDFIDFIDIILQLTLKLIKLYSFVYKLLINHRHFGDLELVKSLNGSQDNKYRLPKRYSSQFLKIYILHSFSLSPRGKKTYEILSCY